MKKIVVYIVVGVAAAAIAAAAFVYSGAYDIAADAPHWTPTERVIAALRERSIAVRARGIDAPPLDAPAKIAAGAKLYSERCAVCHLAPAAGESELRKGLYPQPPDLVRGHGVHEPQRTFWVIKHGIKMTGMPAWGASRSDDEIWSLVAFLRRLPDLNESQYRDLVKGRAEPVAAPAPAPAGGAQGDMHRDAHR